MVSAGADVGAITEEVRRLVEAELGREVGDGDPALEALGLDSLQRLSLAVALEDRFRVVLSDLDAADLPHLSDLARAIAERGGRP
jgi:acyl carrier protein